MAPSGNSATQTDATSLGELQPKVLIVDDEPSVRDILARVLAEAGYTPVAAGSAEEARQLADSEDFAVALCDINMPGKGGRWLLDEFKLVCPETRLIMITATTDVRVAVDCLTQGADAYLMKPFDFTELREVVQKALERRKTILLNHEYQQTLEQKLSTQTRQIRHAFLGAVQALAYCLEAKDPYTRGHSDRVPRISLLILRRLAPDSPTGEQMQVAGRLHDIGKIGIRDEILQKPGPLTQEESQQVRDHPSVAAKILKPIVEDPIITDIILHHHERYDGSGYPRGLNGARIPMGARVLAVADSLDAMTSVRPYRLAQPAALAISEIRQLSGIYYDPDVVKALVDTVARA